MYYSTFTVCHSPSQSFTVCVVSAHSSGRMNIFWKQALFLAVSCLTGHGGNVASGLKHDMSRRNPEAVKQYLAAVLQRPDLSDDIRKLTCRVLVLSGEESMYSSDCLHINSIIDHSNAAWVEIAECGCLATEEKAAELLSPITLFLTALQQMGYGFGWDLS